MFPIITDDLHSNSDPPRPLKKMKSTKRPAKATLWLLRVGKHSSLLLQRQKLENGAAGSSPFPAAGWWGEEQETVWAGRSPGIQDLSVEQRPPRSWRGSEAHSQPSYEEGG